MLFVVAAKHCRFALLCCCCCCCCCCVNANQFFILCDVRVTQLTKDFEVKVADFGKRDDNIPLTHSHTLSLTLQHVHTTLHTNQTTNHHMHTPHTRTHIPHTHTHHTSPHHHQVSRASTLPAT